MIRVRFFIVSNVYDPVQKSYKYCWASRGPLFVYELAYITVTIFQDDGVVVLDVKMVYRSQRRDRH